MRFSFKWLVKIASCVLVLCAAVHRPAVAQESPEGRRPSRSTRPPTFIDRPGSEQNRQTGTSFRGRGGESVEDNLSGEPTESIALTLWVLSVGEPDAPPADELAGKLAERVDNLPSVIGSLDAVREMVGKLKVAGMLRNARVFHVTTLNGQRAMAQSGKNQPRIVATSIDPRAGRTNAIQYEPVGTLIELRPQLDSQRNIQVSFKFSESSVVKSNAVAIAEPHDHPPEYADVITTSQFNTTAQLKNDTAVLLQSLSSTESDDEDGTETVLFILGAAVVPVLE